MGKGKPKMQIRKPPANDADTDKVTAFISGDSEKHSTPEIQKSGGPDAQTSSQERRQTTIYFDYDIFKELKVHCVLEDVEMSSTVTKAVRQYLKK
jgi:hypothetical protein